MQKKKNKLMILGAGTFQLPAIRRAVDSGIHVTTVDYLPGNVGHKYSHHYINRSTTDKAGIFKDAVEIGIDGIMSIASDAALPAVAYTAAHMNLPGVSEECVSILIHKDKFRQFQKSNHFPHPAFIYGSRFVDIRDFLTDPEPKVIKPADTSGSRGVFRVNRITDSCGLELFEKVRQFSATGIVCVESFIEGRDVSVDGFLENGKIVFSRFTKKYKRGFVILGHSLPSELSPEDQSMANGEIERELNAAGYTSGPFDADVCFADEDVYIIEISPRLGGNAIPSLIKHHCGVDLIEMNIRNALGQTTSSPAMNSEKIDCAAAIIGSERAGVLKSMRSADSLLNEIPDLLEFGLNCRIGEQVQAHTNGREAMGFTIFKMKAGDDFFRSRDRIIQAMEIVVE